MKNKYINAFKFDDGYWQHAMQVVPISDCLWKKEKLVHTCTGLNEIVKVVVPGGSLSW